MLANRVTRTAALMAAVAALMVGAAAPALAASTSVTADISGDNTGTKMGTATFTRTAASNGTESLAIHINVPGGISESRVCLSATPFTSRVAATSCPYQQGATGTTADYTIDLGSTYAGKTLSCQLAVVTNGSTAFAGWKAGSPFYGDVDIAAPLAETTVPVMPVGGVVAAGLAAIALGLRLRREPVGQPADEPTDAA